MNDRPSRQTWFSLHVPGLPVSMRMDRRVPMVAALLLVLTAAVMVVNAGTGDYPIAPLDVLRTAFHVDTVNPQYDFIVNTLRLPRILVAALVGIALGISGLILQSLTRNPLASPDILGIDAGAGLVVVTLIVAVGGISARGLSAAAFAGAALTALLIYLLAWRKGDSPIRLILVGIGLGAVLEALTTIILTYGEINSVQRALIWLTGSVYGATWAEVRALLPWVLIFGPLAFVLSRDLNALNLGEDVANNLGVSVQARRALLLLSSVALAGASVAAAGTIAFVALIAPHIARRLVGADHAGLVPVSGLVGALIVTGADWVGRTIFAPTELPCGLIVSMIGAPFFLFLLWQMRKGAT